MGEMRLLAEGYVDTATSLFNAPPTAPKATLGDGAPARRAATVRGQDALIGRVDRLLSLFPTRRAAAVAGGVSTDQIARYAGGRSAPPFPVLARLAEAVDVSLDWVALGTGTMLRANRAEIAGPGLAVAGLRPRPGTGDWYERTALAVRLPAHPGLAAEATLIVMVPDDRLRGDGIGAGHACYCVAGLPPLPDDVVYVEQADGSAALRRLVASGDGAVTLAGAVGIPERLALARVTRLAPVVLVRRKW